MHSPVDVFQRWFLLCVFFLSLCFLTSALPSKMQHHSHMMDSAIHTFSVTGVRNSNHRLQPYHSRGDIIASSIECTFRTRRNRWLGDANQVCVQVSETGPIGGDRHHGTKTFDKASKLLIVSRHLVSMWEAIDCYKHKTENSIFPMKQVEWVLAKTTSCELLLLAVKTYDDQTIHRNLLHLLFPDA
jgi:hypothetical protein